MKIAAKCVHVSTRNVETITIEINDSATFKELFEQLGFSKAGVDYIFYFPIFDQYFTARLILPYLMVDGVLRWHQPYSEAKINDFLKTHNIDNGEIRLTYGYCHADGPNFPEFFAMWNHFYSVIQNIDPLLGVGGAAFSLLNYLRKKINRLRVPNALVNVAPSAVFGLIASRDKWNSTDLADLIGIERSEAKNLLKVCCYRRNRRNSLYVQTERTKVVLDALNKVRWD